MAITADDRYLFTGDCKNATIKQFRVSDGRVIKNYPQLFEGGIVIMTTTLDNKYLFAGGNFGELKQICLESQEEVRHYGKIHDGPIYCLELTRDSKYLITGSRDQHVKRISIEDRAVEKDFGQVCGGIRAMKISVDQQKLFIGDGWGQLILMSLTDGTTIKHFGQIYRRGITGIVITGDEKFFFTSSEDAQIKQWNYGDSSLFGKYGKIGDYIECLCL
jgi:WD40 repeat protein